MAISISKFAARSSIYASIIASLVSPWAAMAQVGTPQPAPTAVSAITETRFTQLMDLNKRSAVLVEAAKGVSTPASEFRIDATLYREDLRKLVQENPGAGTPGRIPDMHLQEMIRMSALLHAAAQCKTGRYVVCPADLIRQLVAQQQRISEQLKVLGAH